MYLLFVGLNHVGLCEEEGYDTFTEVDWDCVSEPPVSIVAGKYVCVYCVCVSVCVCMCV